MIDSPVKVRRVIHTIHAVADIAACRAAYLNLLGGMIFAEGYFEAEDRDMALLYVADHMIEPMAPRDPARLEKHCAVLASLRPRIPLVRDKDRRRSSHRRQAETARLQTVR